MVVWLPSALRHLAGDARTVNVPGTTVKACLAALIEAHPGVEEALFIGGMLKPGVSIAVGGEIVALGMLHPVQDTDEIFILPPFEGG